MALQVGSYIGTGTYDRTISLPFTPECVIVWSENGNAELLTSSLATLTPGGVGVSMDLGTLTFQYAGASIPSTITELVPGGFRVQDDPGVTVDEIRMDRAGARHFYIAANTDGGYFAHGAFAPPSGASFSNVVVSTGFAPSWAFMGNSSALDRAILTSPSFPYPYGRWWSLGNISLFNELLATGLELTGSWNNAAYSWIYWLAFGAAPGIVAVTTHVGDGTAAKAISGVGFAPTLVLVTTNKNTNGGGAANQNVVRHADMPAGHSHFDFGAIAINRLTDGILSCDADGFTVGSNQRVNELGTNTAPFDVPPYGPAIHFDALCLYGPAGGVAGVRGARSWAAIL